MKKQLKNKKIGKRHMVVPDVQVRSGVKLDHLEAAGNYAAEKRPDEIVLMGDWWDFPSLDTHNNRGHIDYEGARWLSDLQVGQHALELFMRPIKKERGYDPRVRLIKGNHENRQDRTIAQYPQLKGVIGDHCLGLEKFGIDLVPFLKVKKIDGICYCHYFVTGKMDKPIGSARQLINKYHQSCIAGHQQGRDIAYSKNADGKPITSIIAGSFYQHKEKYMSPQSNNHWRGIYLLSEVMNGSFDEMAVSLRFLKNNYV